jgi:hypothetical protein
MTSLIETCFSCGCVIVLSHPVVGEESQNAAYSMPRPEEVQKASRGEYPFLPKIQGRRMEFVW